MQDPWDLKVWFAYVCFVLGIPGFLYKSHLQLVWTASRSSGPPIRKIDECFSVPELAQKQQRNGWPNSNSVSTYVLGWNEDPGKKNVCLFCLSLKQRDPEKANKGELILGKCSRSHLKFQRKYLGKKPFQRERVPVLPSLVTVDQNKLNTENTT